MGGQPVDTLGLIDRRGAEGDRAGAVFDVHKGAPRRLTAREAPRLLAWRATYGDDPARPGCCAPPTGQSGRGRTRASPAAVAADLGREVTLRTDPHGLQQDLPDSLLVTVQATFEAVGRELETGLDLRRFRTNVHVELDADAFAEERWRAAGCASARPSWSSCIRASAAPSPDARPGHPGEVGAAAAAPVPPPLGAVRDQRAGTRPGDTSSRRSSVAGPSSASWALSSAARSRKRSTLASLMSS